MGSFIGKLYFNLPVSQRIERVWKMAHIDFINRYYDSYLGLIWAFINPAIRMGVYYVVFTLFLTRPVDNFAFYLFTGLLIWLYFSEATNKCMMTLQQKIYLIDTIQFNKLDLFFSAGLSMLIGFVFNTIVYIVVALLFGISFSLSIILVIPLILNIYILSVAVGIILATIRIYFKDISHFWNLLTFMLFWTCPIFFRGESIIQKIPIIMYANPVSGIIMNARSFLLDASWPDPFWAIYGVMYALVLMLIAVVFFNRFSDKIFEFH